LLSFPYRWGFTPRAIRALLGEQGFVVRRIRGDALVLTGDQWTRRWAMLEEHATKAVLSVLARFRGTWAPWIEVYARRE
jgi:hypothetical protein